MRRKEGEKRQAEPVTSCKCHSHEGPRDFLKAKLKICLINYLSNKSLGITKATMLYPTSKKVTHHPCLVLILCYLLWQTPEQKHL